MTEPRDPFENWLHTQVEPLPPPPGTFGRIQQRARRRKVRRVAVSAASACVAAGVIVLAVVALPRVPSMLHLNRPHPVPAAASRHSSPSVGYGSTASKGARPVPSSPPATSTVAPPAGTGPVPANFAPSSVTFVSLHTGFVIGQAGTPGHCANANPTICTSVAVTTDGGRTWAGLPAPDTGAPDGSTGVSQIRFINSSTGWAFGPELWVTRDGGHSWAQVSTHGMRVTGLETVGSQVYAVFARCTGTGPDFAAACKHVRLYSSPASSDDWTPMTGSLGWNNGYVSAKVVLGPGQGGALEGYFYEPDGMLLTGAASPGATWQLSQTPANCQPLGAQADGQPLGGQLAATGNGGLALACPGVSGSNQETIYTSADGGQSWQQAGTFTVSGTATSLAEGSDGVLTLATTAGLYTSSDGGQSWRQTAQGVAGGFSYVGLTSSQQGVAVPADPGSHHAAWFTYDGGQTWQRHPVTNG